MAPESEKLVGTPTSAAHHQWGTLDDPERPGPC
eukprot:CAMPEP_0174343448 /NCGR_PEP_ID=MMETSP0810-20121108/26964_1 /TAXON_ID=73025 ORGANISM="Eutreptiella gymnastica-like, Strain CCMP1594" /NCGR_SAMPLE_ID=MMETSP0810 /ASSEMBLY_ACC=CAM_ASM_000659 /LENGTH=32 /DNA_ID= /DNA_START= /DNA_END= /DNA_ORIENTATION=